MAKCYDGCWDSETQRRHVEEDRLMSRIRKIESEAHCTYFPGAPGSGYQVWASTREIGPLRGTRLAALQAALEDISTH